MTRSPKYWIRVTVDGQGSTLWLFTRQQYARTVRRLARANLEIVARGIRR